MTAPAIPTGEVVVPVTESATPAPADPEVAAESAFDLDQFAANLAKELTPGSNVVKEEEETSDAKAVDDAIKEVVFDANAQRNRDAETGKFVKADGTVEEKKEEPTPEVKAEAPPVEQTPEQKADAEKTEPKKPSFTVYANGQTAEPPAVEIEFAVNGKTVREPLDKVVRRAQSAGYNAKLEEEVAQTREFVPQAKEYIAKLETGVKERDEYMFRLLAEPDFYLQQQEVFQKTTTPEAQLERERAERQKLEQRLSAQESVTKLAQATDAVILPKFQALLEKYPQVTEEELFKTFTPLVRPLQSRAHGGAVPVEALPQVVELMDTVLAGYAENLHIARTDAQKAKQETDAREQAAKEAAERARVEAQQKAQKELATAKADLARTIAPVGGNAGQSRQKPKNMTRDQSANWALEDALASVGVPIKG